MSQVQKFEEIRKRLAEEQKTTIIERKKEDQAIRLKREGEDEALRLKRQEDRIFDRKATQLLLETHAGDDHAGPSTKNDNNTNLQKHVNAPKNDNALPAATDLVKFRETTTEHVKNTQRVVWLDHKVRKPGYYMLECCWCDFAKRLNETIEPVNALFSHARFKHGNKSKGPDILTRYGITAHQPLLEYCAIQVTDADKEWFSTYEGKRKGKAKDDVVDAASAGSSQHGVPKPQNPVNANKEGDESQKKLLRCTKRGRDNFEDDMLAKTSSGNLHSKAPPKSKVPEYISDSDEPVVTLNEDEDEDEGEYVPYKKRIIFVLTK